MSIKALPFPFVVVVIPVYFLSVSEFDGFIDPFLFVDFEIIQADGRTQRFALCLFLLPLGSVKLKLKYSRAPTNHPIHGCRHSAADLRARKRASWDSRKYLKHMCLYLLCKHFNSEYLTLTSPLT